jgi:hypothetical protein
MAGPIDRDDAKAKPRKRRAERLHHVRLIAGRAVEQEYSAALFSCGRPFNDVDRAAVDRRQLAGRRKAPLDAPSHDCGAEKDDADKCSEQ